MALVRVVAFTKESTSKSYSYSYDGSTCIGEVIRNICVNLSIDPDTVQGVTRNVKVFRHDTSSSSSSSDKKVDEERDEEEAWIYDPNQDLQEACSCNVSTGTLTLTLVVEEIPRVTQRRK